eukprot:3387946-Lingulodinium_polyedra.AAC.1
MKSATQRCVRIYHSPPQRAVAAAGDRFDRIIAHGSKTVQNGAVESTVCRRSGSQTARVARAMRTPKTGVRM